LIQLRRRSILSIYNGPEGLVRGKDGRLSPEPVLGDSGSCHLRMCASGPSSPDAVSGPSSPDDHYSDNINRFVEEKVQETIKRKRLLHGNVPNALKDEICQVLCERSKGM